MAEILDAECDIHVKEADELEPPIGGTAYLAPANYHLMLEPDGRLALSTDPPINFSRPSIGVLFETAAEVFGQRLIGMVLTGFGSVAVTDWNGSRREGCQKKAEARHPS